MKYYLTEDGGTTNFLHPGRSLPEGAIEADDSNLESRFLEAAPISAISIISISDIRRECERRCSQTALSGKFEGRTIHSAGDAFTTLVGAVTVPGVDFWLDVNDERFSIDPTNNLDIISIRDQVAAHLQQTRRAASEAISAIRTEATRPSPNRDFIINYPSTIIWP